MPELIALRAALDAFCLAVGANLPAPVGTAAEALAALDMNVGIGLMRSGLLQVESAAAQHPGQ